MDLMLVKLQGPPEVISIKCRFGWTRYLRISFVPFHKLLIKPDVCDNHKWFIDFQFLHVFFSPFISFCVWTKKKIEQLDTHGPTAFKNEKKVSLNLMKQYTYVLVFTFNKKPFLMSKGV